MRFFLILLFVILCSCHSSNKLVDSSSPAILMADSSLFLENSNWLAAPQINFGYFDLSGLENGTIYLKKDTPTKLFIKKPSYLFAISNGYTPYLVYPNEHITVKLSKDGTFGLSIKENEQRNKELEFDKIIYDTMRLLFVSKQLNNLDTGISLDSVLKIEQQIKENITQKDSIKLSLLNTLAAKHKLSPNTQSIISASITASSLYDLVFFYKDYQNILIKNGSYLEKVQELIIAFESRILSQETLLYANNITQLEELFGMLKKYYSLTSASEFGKSYDLIKINFKGISRDFLLSKLIHNYSKNKIGIPLNYLADYDIDCGNNSLKKIIKSVMKIEKQNNAIIQKQGDNSLISFNGNKVKSIDEIISKYYGKIIILDFWASWCIPCRKEIPFAVVLKENYKEDDFVYVYISFDKSIIQWRKATLSDNIDTKNSFVFVDFNKVDFVKNYNIETIPRYIVIGKNGKIMNDNAPTPSNPEFKKLLEKLLTN